MTFDFGLKRLHAHCDFTDDDPFKVYILMAISRSKNNKALGITSNKKSQKIYRFVIKKKDDIEKYYDRAKKLCTDEHNYYLYVSVTPRDTRKGFIEIQRRIVDWNRDFIYNQIDLPHKLRNIDKEWLSGLALNSSRTKENKKFLIDVDYDHLPHTLVKLLHINNIHYESYLTKNGWHLLADPFNSTLVEGLEDKNINVKKDGELFIESIENHTEVE